MEKLIGKQVIGNYGAMIPIAEGVIAGSRVSDDLEREFLVNWESGNNEWIRSISIKMPNQKSANGSPIGIFWKMEAL